MYRFIGKADGSTKTDIGYLLISVHVYGKMFYGYWFLLVAYIY